MYQKLRHLFTEHPQSIGENYWHHAWFATGMGLRFIGVGLAVVVHAFLPFLFITTGSRFINAAAKTLKERQQLNSNDINFE